MLKVADVLHRLVVAEAVIVPGWGGAPAPALLMVIVLLPDTVGSAHATDDVMEQLTVLPSTKLLLL